MKKLMTKIGIVLIGCVLLALPIYAAMDNIDYSLVVKGLGANRTNEATYVLRGEIERVAVIIPTGVTGTVTVLDSEENTIFSKSGLTAGTNVYQPRVAIHTSAGTAITDSNTQYIPRYSLTNTTDGSTSIGIQTNTFTTTYYGKMAVAGDVRAQIVSTGPATLTNTCIIRILLNK